MTKLEEEMCIAIHGWSPPDYHEEIASSEINDPIKKQVFAAAEIVKKYIEKAWDDGLITGEVAFEDNQSEEWIKREKQQWLKENGIIE